MTVTPDHFLEGIKRDILPGGSAMGTRRALVIHFTAGATGKSSIAFWRTPAAKGACAHLVIERDGLVTQCRAFNRTAGHAGVSRWVDPNTGKRYTGLNSCTIGIELANAGNDDDALKWARKQASFVSLMARHRNGGSVVEWECFDPRQIVSCTLVAQALVSRYKLDDLTGHDCIAPERKDDPGPAFSMQTMREACGFTGLPVVHDP